MIFRSKLAPTSEHTALKRSSEPKKRSSGLTGVAASLALVFALSGCAKKTTEDHLEAAADFSQEGNYNAAVVELKNAIQLAPDMATARYELGKAYLLQNKFEAAEKELNKSLELGMSAVDVIPYLARAYQGSGANSALEVIDHELIGLTTVQKAEVGFFKAQSLIQLNKIDKATVLIDQLVDLDTDSAYRGLARVLKLILERENVEALTQAVALQKQAPLNKDVLNITARLYMLNEEPEKAADVYAKYVKAAPEDIETKFRLAAMLVQQNRTEEAEPHVDDLLQINDQHPLLNQLKGVIKAAAQDYEAAQRFSETAINNGRTDPTVRMVAGYSAYRLADYEASSMHLEAIASDLPDNHPALRVLAASQLQTGKSVEASNVLNRLDNLTAEDASLFSKTGYELLQSGNITKAKEVVGRADGISEEADDLTRLGMLKLELNNVEGILDLENAVEKSPDSVTARSTLATAYLAANELEKASELATEWKRESSDQPGGFLLAGEVAARQGDLAVAEREYMTAAALAPTDNKVKMSLVSLDILNDKPDEALNKLSDLLKNTPSYKPAISAYFSLMSKQDKAQEGMQPALEQAKNAPQDYQLKTTIAKMYVVQGKDDEALSVLNEIPSDSRAPQAFWTTKGLMLFKNGSMNAAKVHYETWLDIAPNNPDAVFGNLLLLDSQNKYPEGLALLNKLTLVREAIQFDILKSYFLVMSGDVEGGKALLQSFNENVQLVPFVRGVKARISLLERRPADAIEDAKAAYEANPNTKNLVVLVQAYDQTNNAQASSSVLEKHTDANPNDLQALMLHAEKAISSDNAEAIKRYEAALELNENNFVVLNNLAYVLTQEGQLERAAPLAKRAFDLKPNNPPTVDTYAQILAKQGKLDEALKTYNRVMNQDVGSEEIFLNYIEVLLKNKNQTIAKRRIAEVELKLPESQARLNKLAEQYSL
ncbi:PEP-CTERM system TPR-repeat protein PrsT [Glaciecola sp. MH2013]|uniref:XrtA/PEP-CTERM system TPR-repeat protein PrsT n=1 Tax=Glaciecola sp. MH2013 TaxID=2785524 RepID=UPI0018A0B84D|nr:XrtA/PEP-CTERM system TPR-repeat protein PrsT [Glaciecola sp. MH2013]MBF7071878.1 PEP-CTERM system TPR-repeat protein PrsT [Glaciecola sp. MH2013]